MPVVKTPTEEIIKQKNSILLKETRLLMWLVLFLK